MIISYLLYFLLKFYSASFPSAFNRSPIITINGVQNIVIIYEQAQLYISSSLLLNLQVYSPIMNRISKKIYFFLISYQISLQVPVWFFGSQVKQVLCNEEQS